MRDSNPGFIPLPGYEELATAEMSHRAEEFNRQMQRRRSVRYFSDRPVEQNIVLDCLRAAGSAPSGANLQPWHFVLVKDPAVKHQIRVAAEAEELEFYTRRAPPEWLEALAPLGTDSNKPFLETAPYLIAIFSQSYSLQADGGRIKHYYVKESVGIATGILITALHLAGLVCLTHTPSPMDFLNQILKRPENERPYLLLVVGYPAEDAVVPDIRRKTLEDILTIV